MDEEERSNSVSSFISLLDPYAFILRIYIKYQVCFELSENSTVLKANIGQGIASITEDELQTMFENIENELLFVTRQNGSQFSYVFIFINTYEYSL